MKVNDAKKLKYFRGCQPWHSQDSSNTNTKRLYKKAIKANKFLTQKGIKVTHLLGIVLYSFYIVIVKKKKAYEYKQIKKVVTADSTWGHSLSCTVLFQARQCCPLFPNIFLTYIYFKSLENKT